jgi:hypothetical protein
MHSVPTAALAAFFLIFLAGCGTHSEHAGPALTPDLIIVREFEVSPAATITLDPSFGFSLSRGVPGVPAEQRAASIGRAVSFTLADAVVQQLSGLGYAVTRSATAVPEPGARALIISGTFHHIDEGRRRRVGAENPAVVVDAQIDYQTGRAAPQRIRSLSLDSRQIAEDQVAGPTTPDSADVKAAAARAGRAVARAVGDLARVSAWSAPRR